MANQSSHFCWNFFDHWLRRNVLKGLLALGFAKNEEGMEKLVCYSGLFRTFVLFIQGQRGFGMATVPSFCGLFSSIATFAREAAIAVEFRV